MSPVAAALAAGLHVATALALFLVSPLNRHNVDTDVGSAIDVTIEQPKAPEEPPPPPQQAAKPQATPQPPAAQPAPPPPPVAAQAQRPKPQPQATPKEQLGLPPEAPVEPDKKAEAKPEPKVEAKLEPKPEPQPKPKPEAAAARPAEPTPPPEEKPLEKVLPSVEQPTAPLTMRDFVKVAPPRPAPPPSPPVHRPPPPQQQPQQPQPSPLSQRPPPTEQREASVSTFQNPAAAYNHSRVHDDYLVSIARRMSQYRFVPQSMKGLNAQGVVVLSLVVAQDGRLLNSSIARSSGNRPMDLAVLETAQKAAPYGPLPSEISGNSATFMLSVPYRFVAGQ